MSTKIGKWAEGIAADFLENQGYKVLIKNWKTRWCEIDIVSSKDQRIHFVEVKFRKNSKHGSGLDYITRKKAKQMEFAALQWIGEHDWQGDYQLDVISVEGMDTPKIKYVPNAIPY